MPTQANVFAGKCSGQGSLAGSVRGARRGGLATKELNTHNDLNAEAICDKV